MSKRTGRIEKHIANLREHPGDVIENDELVFLRYGFENRAVCELRRNKDDHQMLCQFSGEGVLVRALNAKQIICTPWSDIFEPGRDHLNFTAVPGLDFVLQREGTELLIWKIDSEEKGPLRVPITSPTLQTP